MSPENKKVCITPKTDERLYAAPVNPPNTGTTYTSGVDLFRHVTRNRNVYYYLYEWSLWQGVENRYRLITEQEAKDFLLRALGWTGWAALDEQELKRVQELFPDLFEEDA
ncbi:MAG: hypothetical protein NWE98_02180 [Candidatus Bathyarchaeota archaeon]|nr:hypothetical protein [Candidatus Bathyarchaeota archaeon]